MTATVAAARARLRRRAGRFPILLYHRIADTAPDPALAPYAVRPADFRRQMALLRRMGFTTVRPEDVLAARRGERTLPTRAVWVTFDDGYADFEDVAVPILRANGQTATVFVASALVGRNATWDAPGHRLLGWDALRRVAAAGCSVQAHGAHHRRLTLLSDADLASEIAESRDALTTGLGVAPIVFAYPFGDHDARVRRAVAAAGYGLAVTTDAGLSGDDPLHALRRVYVVRDDGLLDFVARLAHGGRAPESVRRLSRAARRPAG